MIKKGVADMVYEVSISNDSSENHVKLHAIAGGYV
jgi:hypothetical protein